MMLKRRHLLASLLGLFAPAAKAQQGEFLPKGPTTMRRGDFETNVRNVGHSKLLEAIIREGLGDLSNIATGHHIMYWEAGKDLPNEFPSADCVIFDHPIAKRVWGEHWQDVLTRLALEPAETREQLLLELYQRRG
jgi:hypothetical protein